MELRQGVPGWRHWAEEWQWLEVVALASPNGWVQAGCVGQTRLCKPASLAAPPPYKLASLLKLDRSSLVSASLPRGLEVELIREGKGYRGCSKRVWGLTQTSVSFKMDGQPRVDCGYVPSANGVNLRPELTLFCVGFLTSPSSTSPADVSHPCWI